MYAAVGLAAAALCLYSAIPSLITYFVKGELISASLEENLLTLSLFVFITTRLAVVAILPENKETAGITALRTAAEERRREIKSDETQENIDDGFVLPQKRKSSNLLPIIALLTVLGGVGYFGYNKFINQEIASNEVVDSVPANVPVAKPLQENSQVQDAMPVETIENIKPIETMDEGNAISIPAIEQNLNTSVVVSNLSVLWEVPAGYVSNATAKRYFTKIGKIVQLNLKSELLLLNKTPITNKFGVELEFNKNTNKFIVKNLTISSGDKSIDNLVQNVVKNALDLNLKVNMNVFSTIVGNPTLIIRL